MKIQILNTFSTFHPPAAHDFDIELTKLKVKNTRGGTFLPGGYKKNSLIPPPLENIIQE